jgi:hypothetical protein
VRLETLLRGWRVNFSNSIEEVDDGPPDAGSRRRNGAAYLVVDGGAH